jgi:glycosyltransferase involved in cell wall biosynthesis
MPLSNPARNEAVQHEPQTPWARRLSADGVHHVAIGQEPIPFPHARAVIFWNGECPVSINIADSFDGNVSPVAPAFSSVSAGLSDESTAPTVSLVICTRDRPHELARCLASLPEQSRSPQEIIVVDNASRTAETEKVCRAAGVRYVSEPRPGLDIARNTGARSSTGEIVAYTDDDVVLHPRWLEQLVAAFDAPAVWAVTGLVLPAELATPAQWHFERFWGFGRGFERTDFGPDFLRAHEDYGCPAWLIGAGASMAFRRETFERAGFFDERLDVGAAGCSGDSEFWHRILCCGGICRYEPSAVAFHYHRRDWTGLSRQIRAYMRGHAAALLVQYERSGRSGNLRRLFFAFPQMYARRLFKWLAFRSDVSDRMTREEVAGLLSGIWFYLRTLKSRVAT